MVHGEQWSALTDDRRLTEALIPTLLELGSAGNEAAVTFFDQGVPRKEVGFTITYPETPLRFIALCATNSATEERYREFNTAFPLCHEGIESEFEIDEVLPDPEDPMEGGLCVGTLDGAGLIYLVDPFFFVNRDKYAPGIRVRMSIAGLALKIKPASMKPVRITEGSFLEFHRSRMMERDPSLDPTTITFAEIRMAGGRMLFPHRELPLLGSTFRSPIDEVEEVEVSGLPITRMLIGPLVDEDDNVQRMWLYAGEASLQGYRPRVGDEVEGVVAIQGILRQAGESQ